MSAPNEVTVFSNGMAHFRRRFAIAKGEPKTISLAYRRDHIGDVLGSLDVFGKVKLVKPPAYRYTNDNSSTLQIAPNSALPELLQSLSGAELKVALRGNDANWITGKILGVDEVNQSRDDVVIGRLFLSLYAKGKVKRFPVDDITDYEFPTDSDNAEITKALSRNYQSIKPQSTFVDLTVSTLDDATDDEEAIIQSVIPTAAWKMTYRIESPEKDKFRLAGMAVIDNNTDEDWKNFLVAVVTGEPNTFATDLATAKTPRRNLVKLVPDSALGGFEISEGYDEAVCDSAGAFSAASVGGGGRHMMKSASRGMALASAAPMVPSSGGMAYSVSNFSPGQLGGAGPQGFQGVPGAVREDAEAASVGEFQVFKSRTPVDIAAQSSALVPMFGVDLPQARTVLVYSQSAQPSHPFRAVRFLNTTGFNLNKGSCQVFREDLFAGQGILDACKPDDVRVIPHALENGVRITQEPQPVTDKYIVGDRVVKIKIADGVMIQETARNAATKYVIRNKLDEEFRLVMEHQQTIPNSEMTIEGIEFKRREKIATGIRFEVTLPPKSENTVLHVTESRIDSQTITLSEGSVNLISDKGRFSKNANVIKAIAAQEEIDGLKRELAKHQATRRATEQKQSRVQQLVASAKDGGQQYNDWMKDLGDSEKTIRDFDDVKIPETVTKIEEATKELRGILKEIKATWENKDK